MRMGTSPASNPYVRQLWRELGEVWRKCLGHYVSQSSAVFDVLRRFINRRYWVDNIKTWTGLSVEESIRMTEDRDKWRKYVHGVANPRIEDG